MPFVKGGKKAGGRVKGTPNLKSQDFAQALKDNNFDLLTELINILQDPTFVDQKSKASIMIQMLAYIYPMRKALSLNPEDEELLRRVKAYQSMPDKDLKEAVSHVLQEPTPDPSSPSPRENLHRLAA